MTSTISDEALKGQQSRIMEAMRAATNPAPGNDLRDIASALTTQNQGGANYFDTMKKFGQEQATNKINMETGIYSQMKEMAARGDADAMAVNKAVDDVSGGDPAIAAKLSDSLHSDPQPINRLNATSMVMKHAAALGINPLSVQTEQAKLAKAKAEAAKTQGEANQLNIFNPANGINPTRGLPDNTTGVVGGTAPAAASAGAENAIPGTPGTRNEEMLAQLPTPIASQVKALAEGRMQFPGGFALKSPYWQQMIQAVSQYDPSFDAVNYNARAKTRNDFTSGKSAQNITAINTAIGHLGSLKDAFEGLKNSDYPIYNTVANAVARNIGNKNVQAALKDVKSKTNAVADELAKVFRTTGMSQTEIQSWKDLMDTSTTPSEQKKVIESAIDLMNSRLDSIGQQYNQGMGTTRDPIELLSPKAQGIYQKLVAPTKTSSMSVSDASPEIQKQLGTQKGVVDYKEYFK